MKTHRTILIYFNKIIALDFLLKQGPYTWNFLWTRIYYDIWRHTHRSDVQLEPRAPRVHKRRLYPYLEPRNFYNFFFKRSFLSVQFAWIYMFLFFKDFRKYNWHCTYHAYLGTSFMWSRYSLKFKTIEGCWGGKLEWKKG